MSAFFYKDFIHMSDEFDMPRVLEAVYADFLTRDDRLGVQERLKAKLNYSEFEVSKLIEMIRRYEATLQFVEREFVEMADKVASAPALGGPRAYDLHVRASNALGRFRDH